MEKERKVWDKVHLWESELEELKAIIAKTELVETVKWGAPTYTLNGKNVLGIGGFTNYFTIWFYKGVFLKDPKGILVNAQEGTTKSLRQWRFTTRAEINEKLILQYAAEAIEVERAGMAIKPQKKEFAVPEVLQKELNASPEMTTAFAAFKPYKQNEFLEYICSAKRLETQLSRLEKVKPLILEGRGLNDKYR
ncbi:YdeI/OmpD-associated family protein [Flavobacterium sp.]|uniref:YdeI/OmpD-associated family protein n=1 Tax=Flavobacterium sp. TaxID=239 RepID=UPI004033FDA5